jgi:hypothetical protein
MIPYKTETAVTTIYGPQNLKTYAARFVDVLILASDISIYGRIIRILYRLV